MCFPKFQANLEALLLLNLTAQFEVLIVEIAFTTQLIQTRQNLFIHHLNFVN